MEIKKIGVIGAGTMGTGIAQVAATSGFEVMLNDVKDDYLQRSLKTIEIYNKEELFRRFCQDVFLCLKKLEEKGDLDINYEFILDYYLKHKDMALIFREREIQNFNGIPDFNKKVP